MTSVNRQGFVQSQRITQEFTISQEMTLTLRILQGSYADLEEMVARQLEANPFLDDDVNPHDDATTAPDARKNDAQSSARQDDDRSPFWEIAAPHGSFNAPRAGHDRDADRDPLENAANPSASLADHLSEQLRLSHLTGTDLNVALAIARDLDEDGYFLVPLEDFAYELQTDLDAIERALRHVQALEPVGVGARDVRECLLLQLQARGQAESLAAQIVRDHAEKLETRQYALIAAALGVSVADVTAAVRMLRTLDPKPGRDYANPGACIVPEARVERVDDEWVVMFNDQSLPRVRLSDAYAPLLARTTGSQARRFVRQQGTWARWLMSGIEFRKQTILQMTHSLLRFQRDFFEHGSAHLKPLRRIDVARDIGMHESTVCRAAAHKYLQTPHGIVPFKFFFTSGVATATGGSVSSRSVKEHIAALIEAEDASHPLTDEEIAARLLQADVRIARRTVAKYREALGIAPVLVRRHAVPLRAAS